METKKLFDLDSYITKFSATVLSCDATDGGYTVVLDATAFFPEEGGQSADSGYIGELKVKYEKINILGSYGSIRLISFTLRTE